jgi:hypothetical protein
MKTVANRNGREASPATPPPEPTIMLEFNASTWRMLRRALRAYPSVIEWSAIRNWHRRDKDHSQLDWLCALGLLKRTAEGKEYPAEGAYVITAAGIDAAEMGECRVPVSMSKSVRGGVS